MCGGVSVPTEQGTLPDEFLNTHLGPQAPRRCSHCYYVTSVHAPSNTFSEDLINTHYINELETKAQDFVYALGLSISLYPHNIIKGNVLSVCYDGPIQINATRAVPTSILWNTAFHRKAEVQFIFRWVCPSDQKTKPTADFSLDTIPKEDETDCRQLLGGRVKS